MGRKPKREIDDGFERETYQRQYQLFKEAGIARPAYAIFLFAKEENGAAKGKTPTEFALYLQKKIPRLFEAPRNQPPASPVAEAANQAFQTGRMPKTHAERAAAVFARNRVSRHAQDKMNAGEWRAYLGRLGLTMGSGSRGS